MAITDFRQALQAVAPHADTDPDFPPLHRIRIAVDAVNASVTATNRYTAGHALVSITDAAYTRPWHVDLSPTDVKEILTLFKAKSGEDEPDDTLCLDVTDKHTKITDSSGLCGTEADLIYSPDHAAHFCAPCYARENPPAPPSGNTDNDLDADAWARDEIRMMRVDRDAARADLAAALDELATTEQRADDLERTRDIAFDDADKIAADLADARTQLAAVEALRELSDVATPGPWYPDFTIHGDPSVVADPDRPAFTTVATVAVGAEDYGRANARFLAAAANCVRAALAAVPDSKGER